MMTATDNPTLELACPLLMGAMIVALDIDMNCLSHPRNRGLVQHAAARCSACTSSGTCRHWLGGAHSEPVQNQDFCPNAGLFTRFKGSSALAG